MTDEWELFKDGVSKGISTWESITYRLSEYMTDGKPGGAYDEYTIRRVSRCETCGQVIKEESK